MTKSFVFGSNRKIKIIAGLLAGIMLTGCGASATGQSQTTEKGTEVEANAPAWQKYADDPITLDWYVNYSWFVTGWVKWVQA